MQKEASGTIMMASGLLQAYKNSPFAGNQSYLKGGMEGICYIYSKTHPDGFIEVNSETDPIDKRLGLGYGQGSMAMAMHRLGVKEILGETRSTTNIDSFSDDVLICGKPNQIYTDKGGRQIGVNKTILIKDYQETGNTQKTIRIVGFNKTEFTFKNMQSSTTFNISIRDQSNNLIESKTADSSADGLLKFNITIDSMVGENILKIFFQ